MKAQAEHAMAFQEFSSALPQDSVLLWTKAIQDWEHDPSMPNPFKQKHKCIISHVPTGKFAADLYDNRCLRGASPTSTRIA